MLGLDPSISGPEGSHSTLTAAREPMHQPSFVYIMTNKPRGTLYIGVTAELARRVSEHRLLQGRSFTARYNLDKLVWYEPHETIELAIQRETSLKRYGRSWKIELVEKDNPNWNDLFERIL
ncbi:GIY-YIG nuclease family protein [Bosea sp. FBZP-16]|uniref:GIY-YIG nuclease family protein n=1 Tax=Bosea sp. FBZP-16 TaxID=2065382 RepID=UPI0020BE26E7|nr:GIY-YIG nuclease family protein [Bosea sp. FBZP-16]